MKKLYEIPVALGVPAQHIEMSKEDYSYDITIKWNDKGQYWTIDLKESTLGVDLTALVLREGIDLLDPFVLNIGGLFVLKNNSNKTILGLDNLGTDYILLFQSDEDMEVQE